MQKHQDNMNIISICNPVVSNIGSLKTFFLKNGINYNIVNVGDDIKTNCLLICGVSGLFFSDESQFLNFKKWIHSINLQKKQIVGICAGMQMLFSKTDEVGQGMLDIISGRINKLNFTNPDIITYIGRRHIKHHNLEMFPYFSHGYGLIEENTSQFEDFIHVNSNPSEKFIAYFSKDNIIGFQFHPERSCETTMKFFINKLNLGYEN